MATLSERVKEWADEAERLRWEFLSIRVAEIRALLAHLDTITERLREAEGERDAMWRVVCETTGKEAVDGVCPEHGGDGCLYVSEFLKMRRARDHHAAVIRELLETHRTGCQAQAAQDAETITRLTEALAGAHAIRCTCDGATRDARCAELQGLAEGPPAEPDPPADPLGGFRLGLQR